MAIFLDEAKPLRLYTGNFYYPIDMADRFHNSIVYLMTPSKVSTKALLNHPLARYNKVQFNSFFTEKDVEFVISKRIHESFTVNGEELEPDIGLTEALDLNNPEDDGFTLKEDYLEYNGKESRNRLFFNDFIDEFLNEDERTLLEDEHFRTRFGTYNLTSIFRNMLYKERMKSQRDCLNFYKEIKSSVPWIKYTYVDYKLFKNRNMYYDWSYYTNIFFKKSIYRSDRGLDVFFSFLNRFINDRRFGSYKKRTIVIPVQDWLTGDNRNDPFNYNAHIDPISLLVRKFKVNPHMFDEWHNVTRLVFLSNRGFFTMNLSDFDPKISLVKFKNLINNILKDNYTDAESIDYDSKSVIINQIADKLADGGIKLNNLTGGTKTLTKDNLEDMGLIKDSSVSNDVEVKKAALINHLGKVASKSTNTDDAMKELDSHENDEISQNIKDILIDIQSNDGGVKMDKARTDRMNKTRKELLQKQLKGKSVKELLDQFHTDNDLKEEPLPIDSIDEGWKHLKFTQFNSSYTKEDMDADIVAVFEHFNHCVHPMNILSIDYENTSTSEDYINTWTCKYEDAESGKRFSMILDIPRLINDRFMMLRGNEKVLISQFMLLPVIKTNEDEVQMVSNYNKIFVRRKSPAGFGKTTPIVNRLSKTLKKYKGKYIKATEGDNRKLCSKYELPVDFLDMASMYNKIAFTDHTFISFNMKNLATYPIDRSNLDSNDKKLTDEELDKKYMAIYVNKDKKREVIPSDVGVDRYILDKIKEHDKDEEFMNIYDVTPAARALVFSEASVLAMRIPVIAVLSYNIGLQKVMDKKGIKYEFSETRPPKGSSYFKFNDGFLKYESRGEADDFLMNGLAQIDTAGYSITEINTKDMWLGVLEDYGGRNKADGLDNFYDLMMDPITKEVCKEVNIPEDYVEAMLYANDLLVDNKFNRHTDITGNRLRTNEIIVGHLYHVLAYAYGAYRNMVKRNKGMASFTEKRSAVIDSILNHDQTSSDLSTLTPLLEAESAGKVSFKGLSGMNSERAFSIDKRTYDKSMLGVVGMSTGFASTVGMGRQLTIDAGVKNKRGLITPRNPKELDNVKSFSVMEALSPMAITHDDPFRTAMAYVQTGQHQMTVKRSMPMLITSGADQALPYLTSNKFSYKFKGKKGRIKELTKDYMIIEDLDTKECEYVDLREIIRKNSDGGFYLTTKLTATPGLKVGSKVGYNDIVAYDNKSYSPSIGTDGKNQGDISYNLGTLAKVAIMNSDMGYEDSCVIDQYVSEALSTELCFLKDINMNKNSNVYNLVEVGQYVQADDPLLVFQDAFDEKEANELLRSISIDQEELSDIGRKQLRSKVSGIVQDVKIFRTAEMDQLSPTLQKICKDYDKRIGKLKSVMKKNKIDREYTLESTGKLPAQGKLKGLDGVRIEIYVKTEDTMGSGDKLVFYQALKGVCSYVISKDKVPYTDFRPNESVSSFLSLMGVFSRMVPSAFNYGLMAKLIVELTRQCQEELGIKWRPIQDIMLKDR